ncbi:AAA family ATPase [Frigidibacter sp. ROC022]|uniref:AAA family ATPase n=1 Tax=Frigidibacter sp. ROC022 TaxID=2971796 RepID=UPI00215ABBD4|nr:ATP-binding protein [Frigidibacter sp. ROC022]MCR8725879.1 ATP-binding protein [Frigidibacter sp. ROC022]
MPDKSPVLHMLCGKIAAGKSTLAARLGDLPGTVRISEDDWLHALYSDELRGLEDYARCSSKLRRIMGAHVAGLLGAGCSVVLDFPANTVEQRRWMRGILESTAASGQLHLLDTPDAVCLARLSERNGRGDHPFKVTEAQFRQFSGHFAAPSPDEGLPIVRHRGG